MSSSGRSNFHICLRSGETRELMVASPTCPGLGSNDVAPLPCVETVAVSWSFSGGTSSGSSSSSTIRPLKSQCVRSSPDVPNSSSSTIKRISQSSE